MHLYHPMLYVGLGGTGCRIGAQLERRLREELCGPDGRLLRDRIGNAELAPFELPSCLQFVYADLSADELQQLRQRSVPNDAHRDVAGKTAHYAHDLLPSFDSYPQVARNLRVTVPDVVKSWLPRAEHEPRVVPLKMGAGQLPTVGRAAIFETLSRGVEVAQAPIKEAVARLDNSGTVLSRLNPTSRGDTSDIDVFVAFSVAGGTGAGIFYDYLHLIGNVFAENGLRATIVPLVLMPSAFPEGMGGGRPAMLNAGRALLDLFRLVDDVNQDSRSTGMVDGERHRRGLHVRYPREGDIVMPGGSMQTAYLFSRPIVVDREGLIRSVVALVLSLIGQQSDTSGQSDQQSFAASFVNRATERQATAKSGIGRRGVSTSIVGSLTVPFDELADMFSDRLLARAVQELDVPPPGGAETNKTEIKEFFIGSNLGPLWEQAGPHYQQPSATRGAHEITKALNSRQQRIEQALAALEEGLPRQVVELAKDFDAREGALRLLSTLDVFRLQRVLRGDPQLTDYGRLGVAGMMQQYRTPPTPTPPLTLQPPPIKVSGNKLGMVRTPWTDPLTQQTLTQQNAWYQLRTHRAWRTNWNNQRGSWQRRLDTLNTQLRHVTDAFRTHQRDNAEEFDHRVQELYRSRVGVTYLLPPRSQLENTYQQVIRRLVIALGATRVRANATEGELLQAIMGDAGWREAFTAGIDAGAVTGRSADFAVRSTLARIKEHIGAILRSDDEQVTDETHLLPRMEHLLRAAAGLPVPVPVAAEDVEQFASTLAGMLPQAFRPDGSGNLGQIVFYPSKTKDETLERYLRETLRLPAGRDVATQWHHTEADGLTIVLTRANMGVTEVPELRRVLLGWSDALRRPRTDDYLPWRQRLGMEGDWLATTAAHRVVITQRLLAAMWNDQIKPIGPRDSPDAVEILLEGDARDPDRPGMVMSLRSAGRASSWGSLLRAYEEWTLADNDGIRLELCEALMETLPNGYYDTVSKPSKLYTYFVDDIVEHETRVLVDMLNETPSNRESLEQLLAFWQETVPTARKRTFVVGGPNGNSLHSLEEYHRRWDGEEFLPGGRP